jgi:hypothetical protein
MPVRHTWEGHTIDVHFRLNPHYGWLAGGFVVRIDSVTEFQPPRKIEGFGTATPFEIAHHGGVIPGVVRSVGAPAALGIGYELLVDGAPHAEGRLRAENWYVLYIIAVALLIFVSCLTLFLAFLYGFLS